MSDAPAAPLPLTIVRLSITNIKGIKAVMIEPRQPVIRLTGVNGAGKSTVIDSIEYALSGKRSIPDEPIRRGQEFGSIVVDFPNGLQVRRVFDAERNDSKLVLTRAGKALSSPQEALDMMMPPHGLFHDPLNFMVMEPADRYKLLLRLAGVDTVTIDGQIKAAKEKRGAIKDWLKTNRAKLAEIKVPAGTPAEKVDVAKLLEARDAAQATCDALRQKRVQVTNLAAEIDRFKKALVDEAAQFSARMTELRKMMDDEIDRNDLAIKTIQQSLLETEVDHTNAVRARDAFVPVDIDAITKQIQQAESVNEAVRTRNGSELLAKQIQTAEVDENNIEVQIRKLEESRKHLLATAPMPIDGLAITDDGTIRYKDFPLDQAGQADQLRISVAVGMKVTPHNGIRVMATRHGHLLNTASRQQLADMIELAGWQIWIEEPTDGQVIDGAIVIEAGELKEFSGAAADVADGGGS